MPSQSRDVTLNPGQSAQVDFQFVPTEARTYQVSIDGLSKTFTARQMTGWWQPTAERPIHWQWQIGTVFQYPAHVIPNVTVYDIDMFDTPASIVSQLHSIGCKVIAYISCGTWENWRPDASSFPASVKGNNVSGWAGEKWLDIRSSVVRDLMYARFLQAKQKGFDAVEPDNIDGYSNSTGFPLSASDQINYNRWIADTCHSLGLSVGLKNDIDQVAALVDYFDWALNEECNRYSECGNLNQFVARNKAVFQVEYRSRDLKCSAMNSARINSMLRDLNLTATGVRTPCIPDTQNNW